MLSFGRPSIGMKLLRRPGIWSCISSWHIVLLSLNTFGATARALRTGALLHRPVQRTIRLAVAWSRTDFEFVQLVPLFIGTIPLGDSQKFANPATRIKWLWIIHNDIMNYTAHLIQHS